jgi:hypothetical protein
MTDLASPIRLIHMLWLRQAFSRSLSSIKPGEIALVHKPHPIKPKMETLSIAPLPAIGGGGPPKSTTVTMLDRPRPIRNSPRGRSLWQARCPAGNKRPRTAHSGAIENIVCRLKVTGPNDLTRQYCQRQEGLIEWPWIDGLGFIIAVGIKARSSFQSSQIYSLIGKDLHVGIGLGVVRSPGPAGSGVRMRPDFG